MKKDIMIFNDFIKVNLNYIFDQKHFISVIIVYNYLNYKLNAFQ